jgi:redox-sensitive bicupin YhaK (pirin superfamily)
MINTNISRRSRSVSFAESIQVVQAKPFTHGQGFTAYSVNQQSLGTEIAPFLQLDHYFMTQPTFAEHPHQGFSAVTYMFEDSEGSFFNEDSQGDKSTISPGDLHWTQAGSGIRHNETPIEPGKMCHGIQMFVDLPLADKSLPAKAFHVTAAQIPVYTTDTGGRVRVVVGNANGVTSPLNISTKIRFLDVTLPANTSIEHEVAADESVFLLAVKGSGFVGEQQDAISQSERCAIAANQATLFTPAGNNIQAKAGAEGLQYVLCISQ